MTTVVNSPLPIHTPLPQDRIWFRAERQRAEKPAEPRPLSRLRVQNGSDYPVGGTSPLKYIKLGRSIKRDTLPREKYPVVGSSEPGSPRDNLWRVVRWPVSISSAKRNVSRKYRTIRTGGGGFDHFPKSTTNCVSLIACKVCKNNANDVSQ